MSPIYNFFRRLRRSTAEILGKSRQPWGVAETKISAGPSRVTGPAELIEMAQYMIPIFHRGYIHELNKFSINAALFTARQCSKHFPQHELHVHCACVIDV
jgi:hypothetical protein